MAQKRERIGPVMVFAKNLDRRVDVRLSVVDKLSEALRSVGHWDTSGHSHAPLAQDRGGHLRSASSSSQTTFSKTGIEGHDAGVAQHRAVCLHADNQGILVGVGLTAQA
jgi:hypothetical protein